MIPEQWVQEKQAHDVRLDIIYFSWKIFIRKKRIVQRRIGNPLNKTTKKKNATL